MARSTNGGSSTRHVPAVPILDWLPKYDRSWLGADIIAGVTVAALVVPEGMAYAQLAGMPPETALYAAWIALVLYAVFGSSRHLVVGSASAVAIMSASIVGEFASAGSDEFITLTITLAILAGAVTLLGGLLKMGRIALFFSESVLVGFVTGLALLIVAKQLPTLLGLPAAHGNFWQRIVHVVTNLSEAHLLTVGLGLACLAVMVAVKRGAPRVPASVVGLVFGIGVVSLLDLESAGVLVVGDIPAGLAPPKIPEASLGQMIGLLPGALGITLVVFAEAMGPVRAFAGKHKYHIDANQELVGLGAANIGAGLFQGFSVGASLSRTAASEESGGTTQVAGLLAAAITVVVALFLTPLFYNLPETGLAAIVIVAVAGLVDVGAIRTLYRVRRVDFWLAIVAMLGVLTFHEVLFALLVAVVASLLALVYRASSPQFSVLGRVPGKLSFVDARRHPDASEIPGLMMVRPDGPLFFANASVLREEIRRLALSSDRHLNTVLIDLEVTFDLDAPSAHELVGLRDDLDAMGIKLALSRIHQPVMSVLDLSGVTESVGTQYIYDRGVDAVIDHMRRESIDFKPGRVILEDLIKRMREVILAEAPRLEDEDERHRLEQAAEQLEQIVATLTGNAQEDSN